MSERGVVGEELGRLVEAFFLQFRSHCASRTIKNKVSKLGFF